MANIDLDLEISKLKPCVKRGPYINYANYPDVVARVLTILKANRRGDVQKISESTKFKIRTLYEWRDALKENPNFNPLEKKTNQDKRIFTDEEEDAISDYIITEILSKGILFTDEDFEELIMEAFLEKHRNDPEDAEIPRFQASKGFIYSFKQHHRLTSRKCHTKRRPQNKKYDESFCKAMDWLFANVDPTYIVNVDETSWEIVPSNIRTWHPVGKDHVVRYVNANEKDKLTVVAGIRADGTKLPVQFIAKGKTEQVLDSQLGDVGYHLRSFSESGWTTEYTFVEYLVGIRNFYGFDDKNTIHVILDVFRAHITDKVYNAAKELNIKFYLIPAGTTDELQPLDKKIFGPLKRFAAKLFRKHYQYSNDGTRTKKDACQDMVRSWERVTPETIRESFEHFHEREYWHVNSSQTDLNLEEHHRMFSKFTPAQRRLWRETHK